MTFRNSVELLWSVALVAGCTALATLLRPVFDLTNLAMLYMIGVVVVAGLFGRNASILAALLSVAAFDFLFVPPRFTFAVAEFQHVFTFLVMLGVGWAISSLVAEIRAKAAQAVEHAQLKEEAGRAQALIAADRLRDALLSSVSHDLRTPLATITGAATSLIEGERGPGLPPAQRLELAKAIHEEANRLNRLVQDLLAMMKLESGALTVHKEWVPIEEVLGGAIHRLAGRLEGHDVRVDLPADAPLVPLDPVLMEQVLVNLLENAVRHTPDGTPIEVRAGQEDGHAFVEVADRGPGLPAGGTSRLFEKFFTGVERAGGTGLGLAICKGIVEAHGGRVAASSGPTGTGAIFKILLPLEGLPPRVEAEEAE